MAMTFLFSTLISGSRQDVPDKKRKVYDIHGGLRFYNLKIVSPEKFVSPTNSPTNIYKFICLDLLTASQTLGLVSRDILTRP